MQEVNAANSKTLHAEIDATRKLIAELSNRLDVFGVKFHELEIDLQEKTKQLELQQEINSVVVHDIRGTAISLNTLAKLLSDESNYREMRDNFILKMQTDSARMIRLIDSNLGLARIENGDFGFDKESVDVALIIDEVLGQNSSLISFKNIFVDFCKAGSFYVHGVDSLVFSILNNIVSNALEASPPDSTVTIECSKNSWGSIVVRNLGEVPLQVRDNFFNKYVTYGKRKGTGLGTYSARLMARAMGGDVLLDVSKAGATTVEIILPIVQDSAPVE